ncbi:MAG: histidine phosphatase family protein [Pseudomonadales bacterium]
MATLWLIRHAKSDWNHAGLADFERPLNARGRRDGPRMQRWLSEQPDPAHWIWSSDAARARSTAYFVAAAFAVTAPVLVPEHRLYLADPETLLDVLRETPAEETSVALVAHNPGLTDLVNLLCGGSVLDNLPTFGVARFAVERAWLDLQFGALAAPRIMVPKQLE